jgi:hypothetical protein
MQCSSPRKRPAVSSNPGPSRSVVDYGTDDQLRKAMLAAEGVSAECLALLEQIEEGQPVQKVSGEQG